MELTQELKQRLEAILLSNASGIDVLKQISNRDGKAGNEFERIITSMFEAYLLDRDEWISIDEIPPRLQVYILCYGPKQQISMNYFSLAHKEFDSNNWKRAGITHWQPLPKKPNQ